MESEFLALQTAANALATSQMYLDVTGQNIANSSTDGYSRQRLTTVSMGPDIGGEKFVSGDPRVGRGVCVTGVQQVRDNYLDNRYRTANSDSSFYDELSDSLSQIEDIFNEFGNSKLTGLSGQLSTLVSNMKKLQASPNDGNLASNVCESMKSVCQIVKSDYNQLVQLSNQVKGNLSSTVTGKQKDGGVNTVLQNISSLNKQIASYEIGGQTANDLRDQRNKLLDQLSSDLGVDVNEQKNGMVTVALKGGTQMLIDSTNTVNALSMSSDGTQVQFADASEAKISGGSIGADLQIINGDGTGAGDYGELGIPAMEKMLDTFAKGFVTAVNKVATNNGVSGENLLSGTSASTFAISSDWQNDDTLIVKNYAGSDTGNYIAQFVTMFNQKDLISLNSGTIQDYADSISMGIAYRSNYIGGTGGLADSSDAITKNIKQQRQAVSGVSVNEETVNIVKYQQSYNAAAKVISVINDMLQTLINCVSA